MANTATTTKTEGYENGRIRTSILLPPQLHDRVNKEAAKLSAETHTRVTASMVMVEMLEVQTGLRKRPKLIPGKAR